MAEERGPRKLKLNRETVAKLSRLKAGDLVKVVGATSPPFCYGGGGYTDTCYCNYSDGCFSWACPTQDQACSYTC